MSLVVGIPVAGEMGAGIGARLVQHGAEVRTLTQGRSEHTVARAERAGLLSVDEADLCASDIILSITPPGVALATAKRLASVLAAASESLVYVDCNAVNPETVRQVEGVVTAMGATFVDGGIIGMPPIDAKPGPAIYVSGEASREVARLADFGLDVRPIDGGIGAASALKMCYGGLTKGLLGLGAALILASERAGVRDVLRDELQGSQKVLFDRFDRMMPDVYDKAYRWVAEMEQISAFLGTERAESDIYKGLAGLFAHLAADNGGERTHIAAIDDFLRRRGS